jgi:hypothetical protein
MSAIVRKHVEHWRKHVRRCNICIYICICNICWLSSHLMPIPESTPTHLPWAGYPMQTLPESTLTLCQSRLYPPVRDFGFVLSLLWKPATVPSNCFIFAEGRGDGRYTHPPKKGKPKTILISSPFGYAWLSGFAAYIVLTLNRSFYFWAIGQVDGMASQNYIYTYDEVKILSNFFNI